MGGQEFRLAAHAGIALYPQDGDAAEALHASAESALAQAKESGEEYLFHSPEANASIKEAVVLETGLRRAIERGELVLHYQPKVDVRTRTPTGVEALMRWRSPDLGLVSPAGFIPLMEETGLILQAGSWALEQAAGDARRLAEGRAGATRTAVNVSAIQLRQVDFADSLPRAMGQNSSSHLIDLEITESGVMQDMESVVRMLETVRAAGFGIAIDDFGTGYSSLMHLGKLPVHSLEIDLSLMRAMLEDYAAATLVRSIVALAKALQLKVIAEGVESEEQAKFLEQA